jgi:hypothetical protein
MRTLRVSEPTTILAPFLQELALAVRHMLRIGVRLACVPSVDRPCNIGQVQAVLERQRAAFVQ